MSAPAPRSEHWALIINPVAGTRHIRRDWVRIFHSLSKAEIRFTRYRTEYPGHAVGLVKRLAEQGFRHFLIIGGDGTLNEVVNGIRQADIDNPADITVALYPYGTGNDWARYWGMNRKTDMAPVLYNRRTVAVDLGLLSYSLGGRTRQHYFLNSIGFGLDAEVVAVTNRLKRHFGGHSWLYTAALIGAVFMHRSRRMEISDGTEVYRGPVFTANLGNGCYSGGGLKQTDGCPTDGLMFATIIRNVNLIKIIRGLGMLFQGRLWDMPIARVFRTDRLSLKASESILFETDGVIIDLPRATGLAHQVTDYRIEMVPRAIKMLVP